MSIEAPPQEMPGVAVYLTEPRHAQECLRLVNQMFPFTSDTEHLKRIRRAAVSAPSTEGGERRGSSSVELELLIDAGRSYLQRCVTDGQQDGPSLWKGYANFVHRIAEKFGEATASSLRLHRVCLPDRAPRQSPVGWQCWNEVWPLAVPKPHPMERPTKSFTAAATAIMQGTVLPLCERIVTTSPHLLGIACVLVDAFTQQVIATSEACTSMVRSNAAACAAYTNPSSDVAPCSTQLLLEHPVMYILKQLGDAQAKSEGSAVVSRQDTVAKDDPACQPYLANNVDLYVSHEPCVMCAMALVHSRIGRVFFCFPNPVYGGVGSVHAVHSLPSLNHHYRVYHCTQAAETYNGVPLL